MDSKIDMSLDDIIKIDRKEKRKQFKVQKKTQPGKKVNQGQRQAKGNQQNRQKKKTPNKVGSKVKQYRGQIGGNRYVGGAARQGQKKEQSATQQKAAVLKRKAKQAQKVGKQRLVPGKRKQKQQVGVKQRLQAKAQQIKDARELLVNQRRGLLMQGQPRGRGRGAGGRGRGRGRGRGGGRGGIQGMRGQMNLQSQMVGAQGIVQQQQPAQQNRKKTRRWQGRGQQGSAAQRPGMLTMTIANPVASKTKPVKLNRNHNLKQPQTGKIASLSDRFGRIQALQSTLKQRAGPSAGGARRGRGGRQRGRGGRRNAGQTDRTVVIL